MLFRARRKDVSEFVPVMIQSFVTLHLGRVNDLYPLEKKLNEIFPLQCSKKTTMSFALAVFLTSCHQWRLLVAIKCHKFLGAVMDVFPTVPFALVDISCPLAEPFWV
jgi:hypothetical protein